MITAPYGSWRSAITPEVLVDQTVRISDPCPQGDDLLWVEMRPSEGGRYALVRGSPSAATIDVLPETFAVRTLVHEYGGRAYAVHHHTIVFCNHTDQRLYRLEPGGAPEPITAEPPNPRAHRYADPVISPDGRWVLCVRERHTSDHPSEGVINDLVILPADGAAAPRVLAEGRDFYASPRLNPSGNRLAWVCWDHPRMQWDGSEIWEMELDPGFRTGPERLVAGGPEEAVGQPRYDPEGTLHFVSDRSGWWNIYREHQGKVSPVAPAEVEFSGPDWVFGQHSFNFLPGGGIAAAWTENGLGRLGILRPGEDAFTPVGTRFTEVAWLHPYRSGVAAVAADSHQAPALVEISLPEGSHRIIRRSRELPVAADLISVPRPVEFETSGGLTSHALYYAPANPEFKGPADEKPPLVVISHGGPTAGTGSALDLRIQFWTSRGIGVVDVNYGGSTGYGREYRRRLNAQWGVVDVDDCIHAARHLTRHGEADPDRLVIRGSSAGGFTTLCALTFHSDFACGASLYGVADPASLVQETHKFESRYLDGLIGPWPAAADLYRQRSPAHHSHLLQTPTILFQGLEDRVVPPSQTEGMVRALGSNGVPYAYLTYEHEQHGFRSAGAIRRTAEAELYFYGVVLGFEPADRLPEVTIHHAGALVRTR